MKPVPYPIKDWREPTNYPPPSGTNGWRWEFLRRSRRYQAFFEKHRADEVPPYECGEYGIRSLLDPSWDHGYQALLSPAGIVGLPTFEWVERWKKNPNFSAERALDSILRTLTEFQRRGDALAIINRALPIEPQLDAIRRSVESKNEREGVKPAITRQRQEEWPTYLRILDALASGAQSDEIAGVVYADSENSYPDFSGRKRVVKAAAKANELCASFATKGFAAEK